ncbi:hypothetical protein NNA36_02860 [Shimia sp. CNT1-13L.2]|uniref:hypothetical protein n=1 Tax=Shimia sp. CNT1-13L.2 TaxID=2959663 RepID=UPI0020CE8E7D|nr:hypothetical protein [Shimia sp. CNT1-13L.2]MCP9480894.1 hypothetical protein [Shimia sp. CNT1-13L.2]
MQLPEKGNQGLGLAAKAMPRQKTPSTESCCMRKPHVKYATVTVFYFIPLTLKSIETIMKLLLHVGPPKSGTSAIQSCLQQSKDELAQKGIFAVCEKSLMNQALSLDLMEQEQMTKAAVILKFGSAKEAREWSAENWKNLEKEIKEKQPKLTIISEEFLFSVPDKNALRARLETMFDSISVVAYLRDPVARFPSGFNQKIRGGKSLSGILQRRKLVPEFKPNLMQYVEAFGQEAMIVRHFDRANFPDGSLEKDFAGIISSLMGEDITLVESEATANESLPGAAVAALLMMNEYWTHNKDASDRPLVARRRNLIRRLRELPSIMDLPRFELTDEAIKSHIRAQMDDEIRWANETFFQDQPQIPTADSSQLLKRKELAHRLVDWVYSYLEGDAARIVAQETLRKRAPSGKSESE